MTLYTALDRSNRAVEVFLEYLRGRGTDWSVHPTEEDVLREYEQIWALLEKRQIEELIDLMVWTLPGEKQLSSQGGGANHGRKGDRARYR